jgi:NAD(P)-dependent dehydrogenase (short-subunit alcohol dehydrogenase family)
LTHTHTQPYCILQYHFITKRLQLLLLYYYYYYHKDYHYHYHSYATIIIRMMRKNSIVVLLICLVVSTTFIQNADSFLFPKPPQVLGGVIAFQKKQLKCKLLQKKKRRKQKICLLQKKKKKKLLVLKKKKQFLFGTAALVVAGPLVSTITAVGGAAAAVAVLNTVETSEIYTPAENSLNGQSILITGGTTGLGLETAKRLSIGRPENLIITSRTQEKGQAAVAAINEYLSENQTTTNNDDDDDNDRTSVNVSYKILDLDNVQGVQDSVAEWLKDDDEDDSSSSFPDQLDVIINNAGVMNIPKLELTIDGIERQMASNHLGHFILTKLLASRLSKKAKVINVSSSAHQFARGDGGMDFEYCWTGSPNYSPWKSYGQSKLANILFSQELQRRADEAGYDWDVACLHPGVVSTDLWRQSLGSDNYQRLQDFQKNAQDNLPTVITDSLDTILTKTGDLGLFKTVKQGATTSVWLASGGYQNHKKDDGLVVRTDAQYYDDRKPQKLGDFAKDKDAAKRLWTESEERAGISFDLLPLSNNDNVESSVVDDVVVEGEEVIQEIAVFIEQEVVDAVEKESTDTEDEVAKEIVDIEEDYETYDDESTTDTEDEAAKEIVDVEEDGETDDDESSNDTADETK